MRELNFGILTTTHQNNSHAREDIMLSQNFAMIWIGKS